MKTTRRKKHPLHTHLAGGMALALLASLPATSLAEDKTFLNGGVDSSWATSGNWNPANAPSATDNAMVDNGLTATVGSGVTAEAQYLFVGQSTTAVGPGFSQPRPFPTSTGNGILTVEGGSLTVNNYIELGGDAGHTGTLNLTSGSVTLANGGYSNSIGYFGNGVLNMSGGTLTSNISLMMSHRAGSTSSATISDGTWTNTEIAVGASGTGELNVQGGNFSGGIMTIGQSNHGLGNGTMNLTGGTATASSITLGGRVSGVGGIWSSEYGDGTLNLTGGSLAVTGGITLANGGGTGTLNIGTGGTTGTLSCAWIAGPGGGTATVNFNHTGTFTLTAGLQGNLAVNKLGSGTTVLTTGAYQGGTGPMHISAGTLLLASGATQSGTITVESGATFGGVANVWGDVQVNDGGTLQVGDGTNASGTLDFSFNNKNLTMGDNTTLSFTLGLAGAHSTLKRGSSGTWTFDPNQKVSFTGTGVAGTYTGLITGLGSDPDVTNWVLDPTLGWTGSFAYNSGSIDFTLTAVPEPTTFTLFGAALATLALLRRRPTA